MCGDSQAPAIFNCPGFSRGVRGGGGGGRGGGGEQEKKNQTRNRGYLFGEYQGKTK